MRPLSMIIATLLSLHAFCTFLRSISFKRRAHTGFHLSLFPFGPKEANCKTFSFFAGVCLLHPEHSSLGANAEGPRHLGPCREEDDQIDVRPDWRTTNSKNKCASQDRKSTHLTCSH